MATTDQTVFYDLTSRDGKAWSLNPWKTRFLLNYKGLDYRTEWNEYPDLKTKLEGKLPPNPEGMSYTSPTVRFPDGKFMSDSRKIAAEVEKRYPEPSVYLDSDVLRKLEAIMPDLMQTLQPMYLPNVVKCLLNEASQPYWYETRAKRAGMPLDQFEKEKGGQQPWDNAKPHFDKVTAMLKENAAGPYFLGDKVSYADFVWGGFLIFIQRIGTDFWEKFMQTAGSDADVHAKLLLGLDPYSQRSDR